MNVDRPPTRTYLDLLHASVSASSLSSEITGYSSSAFSYGQNLTIRAVGDVSDPWLRTVNRVVGGVGIGLSTSLLIMRVYTKARIMRKIWWDDSEFLLCYLKRAGQFCLTFWII